MRSVVAQFWGGHPFEEKYLNLAQEQLFVLYLDALKSTKKITKEQFETYKAVIKALDQSIDNSARMVSLITDGERYKAFVEAENLEKFRNEIPDEQFQEEFNTMMDQGIIPEFLNIEFEGDDVEEVQEENLVIEGMKTFNFDDLKEAIGEEEE